MFVQTQEYSYWGSDMSGTVFAQFTNLFRRRNAIGRYVRRAHRSLLQDR